MDIFAHALWANIAAKKGNKALRDRPTLPPADKTKPQFSIAWATFWGIFPDLFAFSIPSFIGIYKIIVGQLPLTAFGDHHGPVAGFNLAHNLYQYSHSLVIWVVVFFVVWAIFRRPRYELLGWGLHIMIDIFSHSLAFYPTPFLFPISAYHFPYGVAWSSKWFMITNYAALLLVWWQTGWGKKFK